MAKVTRELGHTQWNKFNRRKDDGYGKMGNAVQLQKISGTRPNGRKGTDAVSYGCAGARKRAAPSALSPPPILGRSRGKGCFAGGERVKAYEGDEKPSATERKKSPFYNRPIVSCKKVPDANQRKRLAMETGSRVKKVGRGL